MEAPNLHVALAKASLGPVQFFGQAWPCGTPNRWCPILWDPTDGVVGGANASKQGLRLLKVALVAGTRPEVIKLAPLRLEMIRRHWRVSWISTNQQKELNVQALEALGIVPDVETRAPDNAGSVAQRLAQLTSGLDQAFQAIDPDLVVVQGDTSSTVAGALAAFAGGRRLAHVEAGLRTGDMAAPFPEEGWRRVVTQLANWHFAPTERAAANLLAAGTPPDSVFMTGNTGVDAILHLARPLRPVAHPRRAKRQIMVTLHRRELWDRLDDVLSSLIAIRDRFEDVEIVFVLHANPRLREPVMRRLDGQPRITVQEPLPYAAFLQLIGASHLVLSDSGGIQEEAPVLGVPVLVLRETTERQEAVEAGVARLVGYDPDMILRETSQLLSDPHAHAAMVREVSPFGDGKASERICGILKARMLIAPEAEKMIA